MDDERVCVCSSDFLTQYTAVTHPMSTAAAAHVLDAMNASFSFSLSPPPPVLDDDHPADDEESMLLADLSAIRHQINA
jgi:hypothetical protein